MAVYLQLSNGYLKWNVNFAIAAHNWEKEFLILDRLYCLNS
jgi:hypothetical protein